MRIRQAKKSDLLEVGRVAHHGYWAAYRELLDPATIGRMLGEEFSPSRLKRRLLAGGVLVAEKGAGIVGFVDVSGVETGLQVVALAVDPEALRRRIGTNLIAEARIRHRDLPMRVDLLLGNTAAERFFETMGFVPGEVVPAELFDETVVERRWWVEANVSHSVAYG